MGKREKIRSGMMIFVIGIAFMWAISAVGSFGILQAQTATPEPTATNEPAETCTVSASALNVRNGPSIQYDKVDSMGRDDSFTPIVRIADSSWVFGSGSKGEGWVAANLLQCKIEISELPVMEFPLEPCQVDSATVDSDPQDATAGSSTAISKSGSGSSGGAASGGSASSIVGEGNVTLIAPLVDVIQGRKTFQWESSVALQPGQAYEIVFWEPGQDPMSDGFSLVGAKPATEIVVNLDKAVRFIPQLESGKEYQWGVLVVQSAPYNRLKFLGGGHRFTFLTDDGGGSSDDSSSGPLPGTGGK